MDQVDLEDLEDPGDRKIKTIEAKKPTQEQHHKFE